MCARCIHNQPPSKMATAYCSQCASIPPPSSAPHCPPLPTRKTLIWIPSRNQLAKTRSTLENINPAPPLSCLRRRRHRYLHCVLLLACPFRLPVHLSATTKNKNKKIYISQQHPAAISRHKKRLLCGMPFETTITRRESQKSWRRERRRWSPGHTRPGLRLAEMGTGNRSPPSCKRYVTLSNWGGGGASL